MPGLEYQLGILFAPPTNSMEFALAHRFGYQWVLAGFETVTILTLTALLWSGGQFFGIHASNNGRIMIFAGGIPLKRNGKVVGAIGVSGGSGDQDHAVAEAGAAAF